MNKRTRGYIYQIAARNRTTRIKLDPRLTHLHLKPERHIEILRDHVLRPDLGETIIGVDEAGILNGGPSQEGVVTDEGGNLAVGAAERNGLVDSSGKVGDTILKVVT